MLSSESLGALLSYLPASADQQQVRRVLPSRPLSAGTGPSCSSSSQSEHSALTRWDPVHTEMSPVT